MVAPAIGTDAPLQIDPSDTTSGAAMSRWPPDHGGGTQDLDSQKKKGPRTGPFRLRETMLLGRRVGLAVLPDVNVIDRVLDVALLVVGQRAACGIVGAGAQRGGDLVGLDRLGLFG